MTVYLLDTNTCIRYLNQRSEAVVRRLNAVADSDIALCSVVRGELYAGAMKSQFPEITLAKQQRFVQRFISLPFDDSITLTFARIRASLEQAGTPIGAYDLMIGAIAHHHGLILVTHNTREFGRINDLKLEDWEIS